MSKIFRKRLSMCLAGTLLVGSLSIHTVQGRTVAGSNTLPPLVITEINPDNAGDDHYEYFEIYNTTDQDINLADEGIKIYYQYDGKEKQLEYNDNLGSTVIKANNSTVFWLPYTDKAVASYSTSVEDFKALHRQYS